MLQSKEVVAELIRIYELPFGGKPRGRFKIAIRDLIKLSGMKNLGKYLPEIIEIAIERGYILDDIGDYISVVELRVPLSYRIPSKKVMFKIIDEDEIESEDENFPEKRKRGRPKKKVG